MVVSVSQLLAAVARLSTLQQSLLGAAVASTIIYTIWYLYTFTVLPALRPQEPQFLPYRIPLVGQTFSFLSNQKALINRGWHHFQSRPFVLSIAQKRIYILSNLADINAMYKAGSTISFESATRVTMKKWGLTVKGDEAMYRPGHAGNFPNPHGKPIASLSQDILRAQLESPTGLKQLADDFQEKLEPLLRLDDLPVSCVQSRTADYVDVSLLQLCQKTLIKAGSDTFFGEALETCHNDDFVKTFTIFDDEAWKIFMEYPRSAAKACYAARDELIAGMTRWLETPRAERGEAATLITQNEDEMRASGMPTEDIALILFFLNWLFNVNSFKLSFWMLGWIASDPSLSEAVLKEMEAGSEKGETPSITHLVNSCPTLNAVFDEAQRLTVAALSSRSVLEDTVINGWLYRAGGTILVPYMQLHQQSSVFGDNVDQFDHTRFLTQKNLGRNPNFKPFGGGNTLCTGRFLARREVLIFVALVLTQYTMEKRSKGFPEADRTRPSLGTIEVKAGQDMTIRLRRR